MKTFRIPTQVPFLNSNRIKLSLCIATVATLAGLSSRLQGQVINGDFSAGLANWTILRIPSGQVTGGSLTSVDIDGFPLGLSNAYYCQPGAFDGRALQQTLFLAEGTTYDFRADLAMESGSNNADGGTVSVYLNSTLVGSYAFGFAPFHVKQYATLSGTYTAPTTENETLSITFTRSYGAAPDSPFDYIDNIQLSVVPEPSCLALAVSGLCIVALRKRVPRNSWTEKHHSSRSHPNIYTAGKLQDDLTKSNSTYRNNALSGGAFTA